MCVHVVGGQVHVCACVFMCAHMHTAHMRSTSDVFLSCSPSHYFETESLSFLLFPTAVIKSPAKATLRDKGLILAHSLRVQFTMTRKIVSQELKAAGNFASPVHGKQRMTDGRAQFFLPFLLFRVLTP